jgi:hypothetical protein
MLNFQLVLSLTVVIKIIMYKKLSLDFVEISEELSLRHRHF